MGKLAIGTVQNTLPSAIITVAISCCAGADRIADPVRVEGVSPGRIGTVDHAKEVQAEGRRR